MEGQSASPAEGRDARSTQRGLQALIRDPRFRGYHRDLVQRREFSAFDVLQYSHYEIRHSNVVAWLLRPDETHGIGARFLNWFVGHVGGRLAPRDVEPLSDASFEAANVDVWRERDYVDVTIRFKREKWLIAVENKPEPAQSHHLEQVMGYDVKLRAKHGEHRVASVLLSASPDGTVEFPKCSRVAHVGWDAVHAEVDSLLKAGEFECPSVRAFVKQYVGMIDRWLRPGGQGFRALLDDHRLALKELRRALEEDGESGVRGKGLRALAEATERIGGRHGSLPGT